MLNTHFWRKYFRDYDLLNELMPYQELLATFVDVVKPSGKKILDAGCGTGNLALLLSKGGAQVTGLDFSEAGLEIFEKKLPDSKIILHDLIKPLPFPDESFDAVVSNNTLYAIPRVQRRLAFKEFFRVLKPTGIIAVANVKVGFSPFAIYTSHIRSAISKDGLFKTLSKIVRLLPPTVRIFYRNALIKREHRGGQYDFFLPGEQKSEFVKAGFQRVTGDLLVYAKQGIFNSAFKSV